MFKRSLEDTEQQNSITHTGEGAAYELLSWEEGRFSIDHDISVAEHTVTTKWEHLLMEGMRRIDEKTSTSEHVVLTENEKIDRDTAIFIAQNNLQEIKTMSNIQETLAQVVAIDGATAAALVDWKSGMTLGTAGTNPNIERAAAGNTNVVRAKLEVIRDLKLKESIEDILITLSNEYHLIRMIENKPQFFIYVVLKRDKANLGLARYQLTELTKDLAI